MKKYKYIDKDGNVYEFTKEQAIASRNREGLDTTEGWKHNLWVEKPGGAALLHRKLSKDDEKLYFKKLKAWNRFNQKIWS